jgi:hypothetical protein
VFEVLEVHDHERFSDALTLHVIELPKISQATAQERRDEAALIRWSRFFAAETEEELEEIAMADPVIEKARQVLQTVSDDPMAREVARLRLNAQVTRRLEEAAIRAEMDALRAEAARAEAARMEAEAARAEAVRAQAARTEAEAARTEAEAARTEAEAARTEAEAARTETLRATITSLCDAFDVPLDEARRAALAQGDADSLRRIFETLTRERAWPS